MQGSVQHAFDPRVFHVSQQDTSVAMLEGFRVAFEDVEEFLDDGLVDGVIVPDKHSAILHISDNGDVLISRRIGLALISHVLGSFLCREGSPLQDSSRIYERMGSVNYECHLFHRVQLGKEVMIESLKYKFPVPPGTLHPRLEHKRDDHYFSGTHSKV